jgi:hypothetical protein
MARSTVEISVEADQALLRRTLDRAQRQVEAASRKGGRGIAGAKIAIFCRIEGRGTKLRARLWSQVTWKPERFEGQPTFLGAFPVEELLERSAP